MPMTKEILDSNGMSLTVFVGGSSSVGVGLTLSGVGTASFFGATDGINFSPISMTPFPSGTAVGSATASGNFFTPTLNYLAIKVTFTRTSGSLAVSISSATTGAWQDAFLTPATIANSSSVSSGANTLTQAAQANRAWKLTFCEVSFGGSIIGSSQRIDIYDGTIAGTRLYTAFLSNNVGSVGSVQKINLPVDAAGNPSLVGTPGNAMTIVVSGSNMPQSIINSNFSVA